MKKIITLFALLIPIIIFAQVPQGISYQAIALNGSGNPVVSSNVGIRLSVLDNSASGTVLYSETHTKTTNAQGLFNLVIGQGTVVSGTFGTINWGTNSKFLKVEMDAAGGTNYVMVGSTQLLSVPYALAADSLVTSPGEGITLVSPNGTPYQVTVNDSGQLSLPSSTVTNTYPSTLYTYGTFNGYNPDSALLMLASQGAFYGFKYFTSGTELKFLSQNNSSSPIYGISMPFFLLIQNGSPVTVSSNGFYALTFQFGTPDGYYLSNYQFSPSLIFQNNNSFVDPTYNVQSNTFSYNITGITSSNNTFMFNIPNNSGGSSNGNVGDFLGDGSIDFNGPAITIPGANSTPKNYRVDLIINFNGSGTYTITQI